MKQSVFDKVYCSSAYCRHGMNESVLSVLVPVTATICDDDGNRWCNEEACMKRCHLMNYGKAHNWPHIVCSPYAIAAGRDSWHLTIRLGRNEYMQALAEAIAAMEAE